MEINRFYGYIDESSQSKRKTDLKLQFRTKRKLIEELKRKEKIIKNLRIDNNRIKNDFERGVKFNKELEKYIKNLEEDSDKMREIFEKKIRSLEKDISESIQVIDYHKNKSLEFKNKSLKFKEKWMKIEKYFKAIKFNNQNSKQQRKYLRQENIKLWKILKQNEFKNSDALQKEEYEKNKLCEDFKKTTQDLQRNIKMLEQENFELKNKFEEQRRKVQDFENYKINYDQYINDYKKDSLKNKSELTHVSEELKAVKKKFDTLIKERDYFKREESRIRQEFNKEKLKISKDLVIKTVELKKLKEFSKPVMLKNNSLEIDTEVNEKEIKNLSEIIEQEIEKSKFLSQQNEELNRNKIEIEIMLEKLNEEFLQLEKNFKNKNKEFEDYKKEAVKSLDFYNEKSVSYKKEKIEIEVKLIQELEKSKTLDENKDLIKKENKKLTEELKQTNSKMTEILKRFEEQKEKLAESERKNQNQDNYFKKYKESAEKSLDFYNREIVNHKNQCIKFEHYLNEEIRKNNYLEQENKRLSDELINLKVFNFTKKSDLKN
jgi:hypothetical protein